MEKKYLFDLIPTAQLSRSQDYFIFSIKGESTAFTLQETTMHLTEDDTFFVQCRSTLEGIKRVDQNSNETNLEWFHRHGKTQRVPRDHEISSKVQKTAMNTTLFDWCRQNGASHLTPRDDEPSLEEIQGAVRDWAPDESTPLSPKLVENIVQLGGSFYCLKCRAFVLVAGKCPTTKRWHVDIKMEQEERAHKCPPSLLEQIAQEP